MKQGDTVLSPKDNKPEILQLKAGELYGNRTHYKYSKMEEEKKEENSKEENLEEEEAESEEEEEENKSEEEK